MPSRRLYLQHMALLGRAGNREGGHPRTPLRAGTVTAVGRWLVDGSGGGGGDEEKQS